MTAFVLDRFLPYQLAVAAGRTSREFSSLLNTNPGVSAKILKTVAARAAANEKGV